MAEAQAAVGELDLPDGYVVRWGGQFENLVQAKRRKERRKAANKSRAGSAQLPRFCRAGLPCSRSRSKMSDIRIRSSVRVRWVTLTGAGLSVMAVWE